MERRKFLRDSKETRRFRSLSFRLTRKAEQPYPRDDFTLKESTCPSGLQERWRGGSDFSTELRYKERIYFEEPNLASLHFYCCKLFAAETKNNEREDIVSFLRNLLLFIAKEWTPTCFTFPVSKHHLMPYVKCPCCPLQPTCDSGLLGSLWYFPRV